MNSKIASLGVLMLAAAALATPAHAATFTVNSTADTVDETPGDGTCADSTGACTLRAAVMEADALAGTDTIDLSQINNPADPIVLTRKGADETYAVAENGTATAVSTPDAAVGDLNITDSVDIVGAGSGLTIIEWSTADQADKSGDRIFHIQAVSANISVTLTGLTLRNGVTPEVVNINQDPEDPTAMYWQFKRHGGCLAIGASATASLFDPTAEHGGTGSEEGGGGSGGEGGGESGFAVDNVTLTDIHVLDCISGGDGGGIYNAAPLTINASVISGNTAASNGGGIYISATTTVYQTTIGTMASNAALKPNHAENGGAIFDTGLHTTTISASALIGNTATGGGALAARSTTIDDFVNSTISGNIAQDVAGGLTTDGRVNLVNSTVAGNQVVPSTSESEGGSGESSTAGVGLASFASGQFTYVNTIIANNMLMGTTPTLANCGITGGGSGATVLVSTGHNLEDGDSCNLTKTGDLKSTDPQLGALANNGGLTETMALPQTSPAVDAGSNSACPNTDQRGDLRPADGNLDNNSVCDIGAFELFVHTADLHIDSARAPDVVYTSDPIDIAVQVHNDPTATTSATGVVITTSALPASFTLNSANFTVTSGGTTSAPTACGVAAGVVTCNVGTLAVGDTANLDIQGSDSTPGTYAVTATVSATAPLDLLTANNTDTMTIKVVGRSDLGVTAAGPSKPVNAGSQATLTFSVTNHGPNNANNARLAAFLPGNLVYKSSSISKGSCAFSSDDNSVTCTIGTLASGTTVTGTLTVTVDGDGTTDTVFGVDADELDVNAVNDAATVTSTLTGLADLKLGIRFGHTMMPEGGTEAVTLTITNLGPSAPTRVLAAVILPTGLKFGLANNGTDCTASGQTVTCSLPGLAVGASETPGFTVTDSAAGLFTVTATVSSELNDPVPDNNKASAGIGTFSGGGGGGGCSYHPGSPFDPTLPAIVILGILGLATRRRLRDTGRI